MKNPLLVTLTGPSGTGKTVLSRYLKNEGFEELVSTTTRAPRAGEIDGVHYHFINKEQFLKFKAEKAFIESITLGEPGKEEFYGVTANEVQRAFELGKPAVIVAEPEGIKQIHHYCEDRGWHVVRVFINNPLERLIHRILDRFHEDVASLDLSNPTDQALYEKKKTAHGSRLHRITQFEQTHWVKPAQTGEVPYELFFEDFGPECEQKVMDGIHEKVKDMLQTSHQTTRKINL